MQTSCTLCTRVARPQTLCRRPRSRVPLAPPPAAAPPQPGSSSGTEEEPPSTTAHATSSGTAAAARFSTRLEHMDTLWLTTERKYADLDMAETELGSYCQTLPPDAESEKCWQAYSFLEGKVEAASDSAGEGEAELEKLNDMAHQLLSMGSMDDVVATFSTLARVEEHRAARAAKAAAAEAEAPVVTAENAWTTDDMWTTEDENQVHALFVAMDADGDGQLSMAEFRQSMAMLGEELDGATVALIGDTMDVHGFITEAQFRDILEAEHLNSKSEVANLFRHHFGGRRRHH